MRHRSSTVETTTNCSPRWPAIIGIIIASLLVLSVLFCVVRIVCFGAECCFCCMSCCSCCGSCCARSGRRSDRSPKDQGYAQQPQFPPYSQYQTAPPPMYAPMQPAAAHYAHFDAPSGQKSAPVHEDALPAMPSWDTAASRRIEEPVDDLEMEKLNHTDAAAQPMLQKNSSPYDRQSVAASPYEAQSPYSHQYGNTTTRTAGYGQAGSGYTPSQQTNPSESYGNSQQGYGQRGYGNQARSPTYAPSVPPSYRTNAPSVAPGRKPVSGSWRDL